MLRISGLILWAGLLIYFARLAIVVICLRGYTHDYETAHWKNTYRWLFVPDGRELRIYALR